MRRLRNRSINIRAGFVAAIIFGGLVLSSVCFGYSGGSGTAGNPYKIANPNDLLFLATDANDYNKAFVLVNDINLAGLTFTTAVIARDTDLTPHNGFQGPLFTGVFDGNGHSIFNLAIDAEETGNHYLGLFGCIGQGGTVKNLEVNIIITAEDGYFSDYVGGLCGINYGNITNCCSTGVIKGDFDETGGLCGENNDGTITNSSSNVSITGSYQTGGLCGFNMFSSIINCYSTGNVNGDGSIGGLCGQNYNSIISDCFSTGEVNGYNAIGGLVGDEEFGSIDSSYSTGNVSGSNQTGGLCGRIFDNVSNCYSTGFVTGSEYTGGLCGYTQGNISNCYSTGSVTGGTYTGGLCGVNYSSIISCYFLDTAGPDNGYGEPLTDKQMKQQGSFTGWDFTNIWKVCEGGSYPQLWYENEKYGGGTGDANNPYLIYTSCQLNAIGANSNDWDKHFKLMADIDMGGQVFTSAIIAPDTNSSISGFQGTAFTGTFDGNSHKIMNFTINGDSNDYLGLFGFISSGSVKNLGLENCDVNGTSGSQYVGGLAGDSEDGSISNCYSMGIVNGSQVVGGLAGYHYGGSITNCYSTGDVNGSSQVVGGLVGYNYDGSINNCYSTCAVSGTFAAVGGLVGYNDSGIINNSYSRGNASGSSPSSSRDIGGLVGSNDGGSIVYCYSTGKVSGFSHVGGLIGSNNMGVDNSFWDVNSSGQVSSAGGTGKTTSEMQTKSTFTDAGWDFVGEVINGTNDIWKICEGTNYPKLSWQIPLAGDFVCPDGVDFYDFAVFANQWLLKEIPADVWPEGGDGIVDFFDWAVFADQWEITVDYESLADFAEQWLKTGARYCIADIAPEGGDRVVNMLDLAAFADNWLKGR